MPKKRRKHQLPPSGDTGPDTEAQREGAEYSVDPDTGARRRFKTHILERMARSWGGHDALITVRQCRAGLKLLEKYELTKLSAPPAWTRDYVDASPKPGDVNIEKLLAEARYQKIENIVPHESRPVVFWVVIQRRAIGQITRSCQEARMLIGLLRDGLNAVAVKFSI